MQFPLRSLYIQIQYDPPISGCADGVTAAEMFTAELTSEQMEKLIEKINGVIKAYHLENGMEWED